MNPFDDVEFEWDGKTHTIPSDQVMYLNLKIEAGTAGSGRDWNGLTLKVLTDYALRGDAPMYRISIALAAVLRHVGVRISEGEVLKFVMQGGERRAATILGQLMALMMPPGIESEAPIAATGKESVATSAAASPLQPSKPQPEQDGVSSPGSSTTSAPTSSG
jgi:hypothetical protein